MRAKGPGESALLLLDVVDILSLEGIDYAVIGAMAASLHGVVRASVDADAVIRATFQRLRELETRCAAAGLRTELRRGDEDDPVPALLALGDEHGNRVDLLAGLRGMDPNAYARTRSFPFQGASLRIASLEDFVAMKAFAGGPLDIDDARRVVALHGAALDFDLLRRLARGFGRATAETVETLIG